jgi:anti-anti-sigma regulatory factor
MFSVKLDQSGNTLTISYGGLVTQNETRLCAEEIQLASTILHPGFRLVVDLTELQAMDLSCSPEIANIMKICNAAGVSEVLRIIPDPTRDIGLQIMSFFHYGNEVYIHTCATVAEAGETPQRQSAAKVES